MYDESSNDEHQQVYTTSLHPSEGYRLPIHELDVSAGFPVDPLNVPHLILKPLFCIKGMNAI